MPPMGVSQRSEALGRRMSPSTASEPFVFLLRGIKCVPACETLAASLHLHQSLRVSLPQSSLGLSSPNPLTSAPPIPSTSGPRKEEHGAVPAVPVVLSKGRQDEGVAVEVGASSLCCSTRVEAARHGQGG